MKFPLRLSMDLLRSKASRVFVGGKDRSAISHLSPAAFSATNQKEIDAESDPNAAIMDSKLAMEHGEVIPASIWGKVKTVTADKNQFVMADDTGKNWTINVASDAKVRLNDKEILCASLAAE